MGWDGWGRGWYHPVSDSELFGNKQAAPFPKPCDAVRPRGCRGESLLMSVFTHPSLLCTGMTACKRDVCFAKQSTQFAVGHHGIAPWKGHHREQGIVWIWTWMSCWSSLKCCCPNLRVPPFCWSLLLPNRSTTGQHVPTPHLFQVQGMVCDFRTVPFRSVPG